MKIIEKVDVALILGFIMTLSLFTAQAEAADLEVIVTQEGGTEYVMTTFENGGFNTPIHPENGHLIPGSLMRFPSPWITFNEPAIGYANNPSGGTIACWASDMYADVTFDEPVCGVGFFYASYLDVTLECFDANGNVVATASGPANAQPSFPYFSVWDPVWAETSDNVIVSARIHGYPIYTLIDDFTYCRIIAIDVSIDIKPGSYPNAINLGSSGLVPVAILSTEDFDATTVDPDTVELSGAGVEVRGKATKTMAHEEDVNEDGLVDLVVQVATENLDPGSFQDGYAILSAETFDGQLIEGMDEITIVPPE